MKHRKDFSKLILKCLKDPYLLTQLKKDPKKLIEKELHIKIPDSYTLEVLQETPEKGYLVIPAIDALKEYSEEELEAIAGGARITFATPTLCVRGC